MAFFCLFVVSLQLQHLRVCDFGRLCACNWAVVICVCFTGGQRLYLGSGFAFSVEKLGDIVTGQSNRTDMCAANQSASCEMELSANKTK